MEEMQQRPACELHGTAGERSESDYTNKCAGAAELPKGAKASLRR